MFDLFIAIIIIGAVISFFTKNKEDRSAARNATEKNANEPLKGCIKFNGDYYSVRSGIGGFIVLYAGFGLVAGIAKGDGFFSALFSIVSWPWMTGFPGYPGCIGIMTLFAFMSILYFAYSEGQARFWRNESREWHRIYKLVDKTSGKWRALYEEKEIDSTLKDTQIDALKGDLKTVEQRERLLRLQLKGKSNSAHPAPSYAYDSADTDGVEIIPPDHEAEDEGESAINRLYD